MISTPFWNAIEPRDPLIARDGRPFSADASNRAHSLSFPFPSTTTGAVRTRFGLREDGTFDASQAERVKKIAVRGPFLLEMRGEKIEFLLPAPRDALLFDHAEGLEIKALVPLEIPDGVIWEPPLDSLRSVVGLQENDARKPSKTAPAFWRWSAIEKWLLNGALERTEAANLGHNGPTREERMHVQMEIGTRRAKEGMLFGTSGLEFSRREDGDLVRLALAVASSEKVPEGAGHLGAERRLMNWSTPPISPPIISWAAQIATEKACRLVLATPADFGGWKPDWILGQNGVSAQVVAACVGRPQTVSGWDFERGKPKPTRRLAPAGSTYFLKLEGHENDIEAWAQKFWMQAVSNEETARRDGFGIALLGCWNGEICEVKR